MVERLHQSYCKDLLRCPALLRRKLDGERRPPSKAMELGTIVDQMVFGGAQFHVVDAPDWRTKAAKEERDKVRENGFVAILAKDFERAESLAASAIQCLLDNNVDLRYCRVQEETQWAGPRDVECEGTPDVVAFGGSMTIDLKVGADCSPEWLDRHVYDMGWDIQAAAYTEATGALHHVILAAETTSGLDMCTWNPLSAEYLDVGRERWAAAAEIWNRCTETGEWPGFEGRELNPPRWAVMRHLGSDGDLSGLGLEQ